MTTAPPSASVTETILAVALAIIAAVILGHDGRPDREFDRRLSDRDGAPAVREQSVRRGGHRTMQAMNDSRDSPGNRPVAASALELRISGPPLPIAVGDRSLAFLLDPSGDDTERNEDANALHVDQDQRAFVRALVEVIDDRRNGDRFRGFAVQHLWLAYADAPAQRQTILDALRSALDDPAASVRSEAILALARLDRTEALEAARRWLDDAAATRLHAAAIRAFEEMNARHEFDRVRRFIESADAATAVAAIRCLGSWRDTDSRSVIEKSNRSLNPSIRRCAATALARLSNRLPSASDVPQSAPISDRRNQP